jgi:L-methionine (R)-S-oxide reductase
VTSSDLLLEVAAIAGGPGDRLDRARRSARTIRTAGPYRWVGIYDVTDDEIAVVGWDGPAAPAHPSFPRTQGLCGDAVATGETVMVGDVSADPRYLTTHATTRSEIVVPVLLAGEIVGVVDVESDRPDAFGGNDRAFLERCAGALSGLWAG